MEFQERLLKALETVQDQLSLEEIMRIKRAIRRGDAYPDELAFVADLEMNFFIDNTPARDYLFRGIE